MDQRIELAGIPVRQVQARPPAECRGVVLFYHGFSAAIEGQGKELHSLAEAGYLALGVDAVGHGHRLWPDFEDRFRGSPRNSEKTFLGIVEDSAQEIPRLVDEVEARGWLPSGRLAVAGISMGGFITYRAAALEPRIRVLLPILGSPRWQISRPESPHRNLDGFWPKALCSQNAADDTNVPPRDARELHQALASRYQGNPERLRYVEFPDCGHFMPEASWNQLWANCLAFLEEHLAKS